MNEFDALLARAVEQARALGIPVSARISPRVAVNRRAVTRFGCCIRRGGEYVIELSERLLEAEERACMQTLAHEVLHTCPGCRNHGALWKEYAARMNGAYGYAISRTGTCVALGWRMCGLCATGWCANAAGRSFAGAAAPRWWITRSGTAAGAAACCAAATEPVWRRCSQRKRKIRRPCSIVFSPSPACPSAARFWRGSSCMWPVLWMCGPCWPPSSPCGCWGQPCASPSAKAWTR